MNKKFTMVCASLLLASAFSVNAAEETYTPDVKPAKYVETVEDNPTEIQVKAINLADGVKFYLKSGDNYLTVGDKVIDAEKNTTAYTITSTTESDFKKASIFEVRSFSKISSSAVTFELYVGGKKVLLAPNGGAVTDVTKTASKLLATSLTTSFDDIVMYKINQEGESFAGLNNTVSAYTASLDYKAADLNDVNASSTTFSFDFSDNELVGNLFNKLTPVTISGSTYFLKGEKAKDFNGIDGIKGVEILAIDNKNNYNLNTSKAGEGLKLRMVDTEKFLKDAKNPTDSMSLAGFSSIWEADRLNNAEILSLNVKPTEKALGIDVNNNQNDNQQVDFKIAAVKTSATDTKAYVTTVANASSWAVVKDAMLGDNTYLAASDFLKADAINTVSILVVNGKPGAGKYYNYVVSKDVNTEDYKAASELDFSMAQNQWVVTNFDGKYTLTLQNRLYGQVLTLRLAKTEAGYEVRSGLDQVTDENGKNVNAVVKFLGLETTATDGYLKLTDEQMEKGIKLSFSGETVLAGEREFFGVLDKEANKMIPSVKADNSIVFYAVPNVDTKKADKVAKDVTYACLNAKGEVTYKTAKANLVVPTYILATEFDKEGKVTKALGDAYGIESTSTPSQVFAFAKNMNGTYSLVSHYDETTDVKIFASSQVAGVEYNKDAETAGNPDGLKFVAVSRYDADAVNNVFANVNVLPNVILNAPLPAVPGHYTFDNERGSINVTDIKGINEGALSSEALVFWLDTADIEKDVPSFYISYGIKGDETARQYMFNPVDSARVFDNASANYKFNDVYFYGENAEVAAGTPNVANGTLKAAFTKATQEEGKDLANQFKFNITLNDAAVADEYVLTTVSKGLKGETLAVAQKNGVVILVNAEDKNADVQPMVFTVNPAEAPTSNEAVSTSEIKVIANNGSVVVKNAAGKNVVVSTILGQVVANEVLTSDNATINVPAGIVVVAVDGESFKVSVK